MFKEISSPQNSLVKEILHLREKSRVRKQKGLFFIEGFREITLAIEGGYQITYLLFCEDIYHGAPITELVPVTNASELQIIKCSLAVYQKLSQRKSTEGIVAVAKSKSHILSDLSITKNALILVAEASEKPGNIGALLRTADAANLDAVLIANPKTDLYNPNIIRSSVGCLFTIQIATASTEDILNFLQDRGIHIFTAALDKKSLPYHEIDFRPAAAIVVGTEATGLSEQWLERATKSIIIPMQGKIDSLNVSVSAAILIFEAKRQRGFAI